MKEYNHLFVLGEVGSVLQAHAEVSNSPTVVANRDSCRSSPAKDLFVHTDRDLCDDGGLLPNPHGVLFDDFPTHNERGRFDELLVAHVDDGHGMCVCCEGRKSDPYQDCPCTNACGERHREERVRHMSHMSHKFLLRTELSLHQVSV